MRRVSTEDFQRLPLRVHAFLAGVPLNDAWAVDLPYWRPGITLDQFLRAALGGPFAPSATVRALLRFRFFVGKLLGWDRKSGTSPEFTFGSRMTVSDRSRSLVPSGTREGRFRVLYRFENEQLVELANRTVHGAALSALFEGTNSYHFYFAVYVSPVSVFTPIYMAAIDPFRKWIVYPSLLRSVRETWNQAFGSAGRSCLRDQE